MDIVRIFILAEHNRDSFARSTFKTVMPLLDVPATTVAITAVFMTSSVKFTVVCVIADKFVSQGTSIEDLKTKLAETVAALETLQRYQAEITEQITHLEGTLKLERNGRIDHHHLCVRRSIKSATPTYRLKNRPFVPAPHRWSLPYPTVNDRQENSTKARQQP
ncbi:hypothetical protein D9757_007569 [Collybiopsis confluens]|uniref:Uncharacterized protein n=1 Tax=Collybiopsis confluens TaxID=2823264 RepID=A0A8H5M5V0_9AGAR|nr:hypothetical protein D9757_007569 [Collybiopsis confluens]